MKNTRIGLIFLLAGLALAGCSGGSSSTTTAAAQTSTAAKVTISPTNQKTITTAALDSAKSQIGSGTANLGMVGGVQASTNSANDRFLTRLSNFAINKFIEQQATPSSVTGVVTNRSYDCASPTFQETTNTTNIVRLESDGASYVLITYVQCTSVDPQNANNFSVANGTLSLSGVTTSGSPVTGLAAAFAYNYNATWNYNGSVTNISIIGGYNINATGINSATRSDTISGTSLNVTFGSYYNTLSNFSFSSAYDDRTSTPPSYSDTISYTYASDSIAAAFDFATNQALVTYSGESYPRSGRFVITSGNSLRLTILPTNAGTANGEVTVEYSSNGGTTWSSPTTYTWATL